MSDISDQPQCMHCGEPLRRKSTRRRSQSDTSLCRNCRKSGLNGVGLSLTSDTYNKTNGNLSPSITSNSSSQVIASSPLSSSLSASSLVTIMPTPPPSSSTPGTFNALATTATNLLSSTSTTSQPSATSVGRKRSQSFTRLRGSDGQMTIPKTPPTTSLKRAAARARSQTMSPSTTELMRSLGDLTVTKHKPVKSKNCPNRANPYHTCNDFCVWKYDKNEEGSPPNVEPPVTKPTPLTSSMTTSAIPNSSTSLSTSSARTRSSSAPSSSKSKKGGKSGKGKVRNGDTTDRRKFHNERERKRRRDLRESFSRCRKAVPSVAVQENVSDRKVLQEAQKYILEQKALQTKLKKEYTRRRIELVQNKLQAPELFGGRKELETELARLLVEEQVPEESELNASTLSVNSGQTKFDQLMAAVHDMDDMMDDDMSFFDSNDASNTSFDSANNSAILSTSDQAQSYVTDYRSHSVESMSTYSYSVSSVGSNNDTKI
eukprot:m.15145 g.15145  ORF g.15145 m.15145 type:complete len:488 (+) comp4419_c0_seq1:125-1588(+)